VGGGVSDIEGGGREGGGEVERVGLSMLCMLGLTRRFFLHLEFPVRF